MAVIEMSVNDWSEVPDNPRQRDTVRRAKSAVNNHLKIYSPLHRYVYAATKDGDVICKMDGHTRSYLWDKGLSETPPDGMVEVLLVEVTSKKGAAILYDQLDSSKALNRPCDIIFGACRENKFELSSPLLRSCGFSNQLRLADGFRKGNRSNSRDDLHVIVKRWKPVLIDVDSMNISSNNTILIGFMLLVSSVDDTVSEFLKEVDEDSGTKTREGKDGVEALCRKLDVLRAEGKTAGYENLYELTDRAWTCYMAWKEGRRIRSVKMTKVASIFAEGVAK